MGDAKEVKFNLKVMINKQKTKVLFAEVDSNFADVLLSFLTFPLGTIVRVLKKHYGDKAPSIGSLTTLYNGLTNLSNDQFETEVCKLMLLNPRSSFEAECCKLKLDISYTKPTKYFTCANWFCLYPRQSNIGMHNDTPRCNCGKTLTRELVLRNLTEAGDDDGGVFTKSKVSFIITDDLRMAPNVAVSVMETLRNLGITDSDGAELRNVTFGFDEIMDLLKGLLLSRTPLTDIILGKRQMEAKPETIPLFQMEAKLETIPLFNEMEKGSPSRSRKMTLKVMVQESTMKSLFVQSEEDFVDLLFSFPTIPLGGVECLLGGKTFLKNIDNLYRSLENIDGDKYLRTADTKSRLLNPKLPYGYISKNQILPLGEENAPSIYYCRNIVFQEWLSVYDKTSTNTVSVHRVNFWKGHENYVRGSRMYMVTNHLNVTPLRMASTLSFLNELKIPVSDVKEVEVQIGLEEALSILKASLTSTSALTKDLISATSMRAVRRFNPASDHILAVVKKRLI